MVPIMRSDKSVGTQAFRPMILMVKGQKPLVRVNREFTEVFGFVRESIQARPLLDLIHPEDQHVLERAIESHGVAVARLQTAGKEWVSLEWNIKLDSENNIAILGLMKSESIAFHETQPQSKRTYGAQILETLDTMARVIESSNPGLRCSILLVDEERKYITSGAGPSLSEEYNKAVTGLNIGPSVGSCGTAAFWNEPVVVENIQEDPLWLELREAAKETGVASCWSYPIRATTGGVLGALALYNHVPSVPTPSQIHGLSVTARMVALAIERDSLEVELRLANQRERDELEKALQAEKKANQLKSNFLANMSHELRTPMNGIVGLNQMLLTTSLTDTQREYLNITRTCSTHLLGLLDSILDLSKIEAGELALDTVDFEARECIAQVVNLLESQASQKGLILNCFIDTRVPRWLNGDSTRLSQVLMNLIGNAIKFTDRGEVEVTVDAELMVDRRVELKFIVKDTGVGIPIERQKEIFNNFVQADGSTTRRFGGTGLGLAISKQIVEMMAGAIELDSQPGHGSTFRFNVVLELRDPSNSKHTIEKIGSTRNRANLGEPSRHLRSEITDTGGGRDSLGSRADIGGRILLVEDNQSNIKMMECMLKTFGCDVSVAENGQLALEALARGSFELVLMDLQMPVMGGLEAARQIRKMERESGAHLPIVALTARAMSGDREKCLSSGMDDYLAKPIDVLELRKVIEAWVRFSKGG